MSNRMPGDLEPLLRRHDPALGKVLTEGDRTRTLQAARRPLGLARPRLAAAFGLVVLLLTAVLMVGHRREEEPPLARQIQYATPGGTRIVWTLDPRFHM